MYYYANQPPPLATLSAATGRCATVYGARAGRVIWFDPTGPAPAASSCTRLLLKVFRAPPPPHTPTLGRGRIHALRTCPPPVRASFAAFAQQLAATGFGFVHRRWRAGQLDGPILVSVAYGRVIGAIGPLSILTDRGGHRMLLPQYFGVLPEHRGHEHGRALWRATTAWAQRHRAAYQLLQAQPRHVSEALFLAEGLDCLGFTCALAA